MKSLVSLLAPRLLRRVGYPPAVLERRLLERRPAYGRYFLNARGALYRVKYENEQAFSVLVSDKYHYVAVTCNSTCRGWAALTSDGRVVCDNILIPFSSCVISISFREETLYLLTLNGLYYFYDNHCTLLSSRLDLVAISYCGYLQDDFRCSVTSDVHRITPMSGGVLLAYRDDTVTIYRPWRSEADTIAYSSDIIVTSACDNLIVYSNGQLVALERQILVAQPPEQLVALYGEIAYGVSGQIYLLLHDDARSKIHTLTVNPS